MRETKAELRKERDALRRREGVAQIALRYLALRSQPDWTEMVRWTEQGRTMRVAIRAYGLHRIDGGIVVVTWRFDDTISVETSYTLDFIRTAEAQEVPLERFTLAEAARRLRTKHEQAWRQDTAWRHSAAPPNGDPQ